jgi:hypothetical protein
MILILVCILSVTTVQYITVLKRLRDIEQKINALKEQNNGSNNN